MICFTLFSIKKLLTRYFFSINIDVTNAADMRTWFYPEPAFTCPKITIETLEQGVKYVQS